MAKARRLHKSHNDLLILLPYLIWRKTDSRDNVTNDLLAIYRLTADGDKEWYTAYTKYGIETWRNKAGKYVLLSDIPLTQYYFQVIGAAHPDRLYLYPEPINWGEPVRPKVADRLVFSASNAEPALRALDFDRVTEKLIKLDVEALFPFTAGGFERAPALHDFHVRHRACLESIKQ